MKYLIFAFLLLTGCVEKSKLKQKLVHYQIDPVEYHSKNNSDLIQQGKNFDFTFLNNPFELDESYHLTVHIKHHVAYSGVFRNHLKIILPDDLTEGETIYYGIRIIKDNKLFIFGTKSTFYWWWDYTKFFAIFIDQPNDAGNIIFFPQI